MKIFILITLVIPLNLFSATRINLARVDRYSNIGQEYYMNMKLFVSERFSNGNMSFYSTFESNFKTSIIPNLKNLTIDYSTLIRDISIITSYLGKSTNISKLEKRNVVTGLLVNIEYITSFTLNTKELKNAQEILTERYFKDFLWSYYDQDNIFAIYLDLYIQKYPKRLLSYLIEYERNSRFNLIENYVLFPQNILREEKVGFKKYKTFSRSIICGTLHRLKTSNQLVNQYYSAFQGIDDKVYFARRLYFIWEEIPENYKCKMDIIKYMIVSNEIKNLSIQQRLNLQIYSIKKHMNHLRKQKNNIELLRQYPALWFKQYFNGLFLSVFLVAVSIFYYLYLVFFFFIRNKNNKNYFYYKSSYKDAYIQFKSKSWRKTIATQILIALLIYSLSDFFKLDINLHDFIFELPLFE